MRGGLLVRFPLVLPDLGAGQPLHREGALPQPGPGVADEHIPHGLDAEGRDGRKERNALDVHRRDAHQQQAGNSDSSRF